MYTYPQNIDMEAWFPFDCSLIRNGVWRKLPSSSKSIFPVIGAFRNKAGYSYITERTVAILAGRTDKTVRSGMRGLSSIPAVSMRYYTSKHGRRAKGFFFPVPEQESFPFHRCIFEKGLWQHLPPTAQALYPVMRFFSLLDEKLHKLYDSERITQLHSYCNPKKEELIHFAGISGQTLSTAFDSLLACELIESMEKDPGGNTVIWKVYHKTESWFPREYLNDIISSRYGSG